MTLRTCTWLAACAALVTYTAGNIALLRNLKP